VKPTIKRSLSPISPVETKLTFSLYQDDAPSPNNEDNEADERERDAKLTQPYFQQDFDERPPRSDSKDRFRRSPSRGEDRKPDGSPKRFSPPRKRSHSPTYSRRERSRSPHNCSPQMRGRSPPYRRQSPPYRRQSPPYRRDPSPHKRDSSPPYSRVSEARNNSPAKDIGDEIQEEIRRQKRRQEEERRREERRKRHAKREETERRDIDERRRRE